MNSNPPLPTKISRREIDAWPIKTAGLSARVVHCLAQANLQTVGELREWTDKRLLTLVHFGVTSRDNVRWFFKWAGKLEANDCSLPSFRAFLREFLNRQEVHVLEQRFGLTDPLFRPHMKRRTLSEIAAEMRGGLTRERVRQIEETGLAAMRALLPAAVAETQEIYWANRVQSAGCVVTSGELAEWTNDPKLGGYQPWGSLLLLSETYSRISFRYDYFATLPPQTLSQVEKQILQLLHTERLPVPFENILATVSDNLNFLNGQRPRLVTVMLDHHPDINGTVDRRYFLPTLGAPVILADILRGRPEPIHFHELTRLYNERMKSHSRKGAGYILRVLNLMGDAQRVSRALYQLKSR